MSYLTQNSIAENRSMQGRVAACAAEQDALDDTVAVGDPDQWMMQHRREWAAAPGWSAAWEYAENTHPPPEPIDPPPPPTQMWWYDPGADESVITDGMILSQIQLMLGVGGPKEEMPPPEEPVP